MLYADGTSGHQGGASKDAEPARRELLTDVYILVSRSGLHGITSKEAEDLWAKGHGTVSSAFSNLHRAGMIVRLQEQRMRYGVYVTKANVDGRPTWKYHSNAEKRAAIQRNQIAPMYDLGYDHATLDAVQERLGIAL